jgi:hypothetical protein
VSIKHIRNLARHFPVLAIIKLPQQTVCHFFFTRTTITTASIKTKLKSYTETRHAGAARANIMSGFLQHNCVWMSKVV